VEFEVAIGQAAIGGSQGVAHPMHAAPLPGRTEHAGDRMAQAVVSVGDHQLDALETALDEAF
jgi:hypothetical protein